MLDQPISLQDAMGGKTVAVRLVCDREYKDDCRANTGIVWRGKGDVQQYPAKLWHKLAEHPDVWELVETNPDLTPALESPQNRAKRLGIDEAERVRQETEGRVDQIEIKRLTIAERVAAAASHGTDMEVVDVQPASFYYGILTDEYQAAMPIDQIQDMTIALEMELDHVRDPAVLRTEFARVVGNRLALQAQNAAGVLDAPRSAGLEEQGIRIDPVTGARIDLAEVEADKLKKAEAHNKAHPPETDAAKVEAKKLEKAERANEAAKPDLAEAKAKHFQKQKGNQAAATPKKKG